jgi:hypothetical protein
MNNVVQSQIQNVNVTPSHESALSSMEGKIP